MKKRNYKMLAAVLGALLCVPSIVFAGENVTVKEYNLTRNASDNNITFCMEFTNNGGSTINLSDVTLRYYFTNEGGKENFCSCDYSPVGSQNVTTKFVDIADGRYLEVGFTAGAGSVAPGQSVPVNMRAWKSDWSAFNQADDYSFNANANSYVENQKVTAYVKGQLVWGVEPGSGTNPGGQNPGEQNPGEQNPGEQNPGEQNPGEQNPGGQNPGQTNPGSMKAISDKYMSDIKVSEYCPSSYSTRKNGVAYGNITHKTYYSNTTHSNRGYNILLPANYNPSKKYPVLYVLHGIFGDESSMIGNNITEIVGNHVADGTAKDMIVVFPNMYASTNGAAPGMNDAGVQGYDNFINDLVNDLMPHIENNYSVLTGRDNTAIAGFSMGGRETLFIGISRPDLFGYVMAIAPASGVVEATDWAMHHKGQMLESEFKIADESMPYALMICCGTNDSVVGKFPESYHNLFTRNNTNHIWYTVGGADHDGTAISSGLNNFVGAIFRAEDYK